MNQNKSENNKYETQSYSEQDFYDCIENPQHLHNKISFHEAKRENSQKNYVNDNISFQDFHPFSEENADQLSQVSNNLKQLNLNDSTFNNNSNYKMNESNDNLCHLNEYAKNHLKKLK